MIAAQSTEGFTWLSLGLNIGSKRRQSLKPVIWSPVDDESKDSVTSQLSTVYQQAKEGSVSKAHELIKDKILRNLEDSADHAAVVLQALKECGLNPIGAHLKIEAWNYFKVLVKLPEEEFESQKLLEAYSRITELERSVEGDFYNLEVVVVGVGEHFSISKIESDGFVLEYHGETE